MNIVRSIVGGDIALESLVFLVVAIAIAIAIASAIWLHHSLDIDVILIRSRV